MMRRLILVTFAVAGLMAPARADVKLPALFSDGLVLQQESKCPIWGSADPGEMVKVTLTGGKTLAGAVKAGEDGKWRVDLATGKAGGPYTLTVAGKNTITLKDVYLGEVWIASGQSNMEWSVNASANAAEVKKSSHNPQIRLFTVRKTVADSPRDDMPRDDYHGKWHECGPDTVGRLSAVAYHFGRYLHETRGVPVGLIHTSWGGTVAEAWTPRAALEAEPSLMGLVPQGEIRSGNPNQGTVLYNGMIAPLLPYTIKGAIWYQGESNAGRAHQYRTLFPTMIASWREAWKNPDMPFFFVQLAPWRNPSAQPMESDWAELREAQRLTSLTVRKTGMAVITDVGDAADIHPRQKEPVGVRLALGARAIAYGEKIEYSGPVYQAMEVEGKRVTLRFTHVGKGLEARYGNPIGFTVAGEDRKFHNANAEIKGDTVVVWCDKVTKPVAVRFGWANCPIVDLWNKDGLPASPFRTDDFPMRTQPKP